MSGAGDGVPRWGLGWIIEGVVLVILGLILVDEAYNSDYLFVSLLGLLLGGAGLYRYFPQPGQFSNISPEALNQQKKSERLMAHGFFLAVAGVAVGYVCLLIALLGLLLFCGGLAMRLSRSAPPLTSGLPGFASQTYPHPPPPGAPPAAPWQPLGLDELAQRVARLEARLMAGLPPSGPAAGAGEMVWRQRMALLEERLKRLEGRLAGGEPEVTPSATPEGAAPETPTLAAPAPSITAPAPAPATPAPPAPATPLPRVEAETFPAIVFCVNCGVKLRAREPGKYRCPACYTTMEVAEVGRPTEKPATAPWTLPTRPPPLPPAPPVSTPSWPPPSLSPPPGRAAYGAAERRSSTPPSKPSAPGPAPAPEPTPSAAAPPEPPKDRGLPSAKEEGPSLPDWLLPPSRAEPSGEPAPGPPSPLPSPLPSAKPPTPSPPRGPPSWTSLEGVMGSKWVLRLAFAFIIGGLIFVTNAFYEDIPEPVKALLIFLGGLAFLVIGEVMHRRWTGNSNMVRLGLGLAMGGFGILYAGANRLSFGLDLPTDINATIVVSAGLAVANGLYGLVRRSPLTQAQALGASAMVLGLVLYYTPGPWVATPWALAAALGLLAFPTVLLALASGHRSLAGLTLLVLYGGAFVPSLMDPGLEGWAPLAAAVAGAVLALRFHGDSPDPRRRPAPAEGATPGPRIPLFFELTFGLGLLATVWTGPLGMVLMALLFAGVWARHPSGFLLPLTALGVVLHATFATAEAALGLVGLLLGLTALVTLRPQGLRPAAGVGEAVARSPSAALPLEGGWLATTGAVAVLAVFAPLGGTRTGTTLLGQTAAGLPATLSPLGPWVPLAGLLALAWLLRGRLANPGVLAIVALSPWVMVSTLAEGKLAPYLFLAYASALVCVALYHRYLERRPTPAPSWLLVLALTSAYGAVLLTGGAGLLGQSLLGGVEPWLALYLLLPLTAATQRHPLALMLAGLAPWVLFLALPREALTSYGLLALTLGPAALAVAKDWRDTGPDISLGGLYPGEVKLLASGGTLLWPHLAVLVLAAVEGYSTSLAAMEPWLLLGLLYGFIRYRWRDPHQWPVALVGPWLLWGLQTPGSALATYSFLVLASAQGLALLLALRGLPGRGKLPANALMPAPLGLLNGYAALLVAARLGVMGAVLDPLGGLGPWEPWLLMGGWLAVVVWAYRHPLALGLAGLAPWLLFDADLVSSGSAYGLLALTLAGAAALYLCLDRPPRPVDEAPTPGSSLPRHDIIMEGRALALVGAHGAVLVPVALAGYRFWPTLEPWLLLGLLWVLVSYRWNTPANRLLLLAGPWLLWLLQPGDELAGYLFLAFMAFQSAALYRSLAASEDKALARGSAPAPLLGLAATLGGLVALTWAGGLRSLWAVGVEPWLVLLALYGLAFHWRAVFPKLELEEVTALGVPTIAGLSASLALGPLVTTAEGGLLFVGVLAFLILHGLRRLERHGPVMEGLAVGALVGFLVARLVVDRLPDADTLLFGWSLPSTLLISQWGLDLAALLVVGFLALTVWREKLGRQVSGQWYATPLLVLLPVALLVHLELTLAALLVPLLLWAVALALDDSLSAPLAWVLLALNTLLILTGPQGWEWSEAALVLLGLGLFHLVLVVGLHLRTPSDRPTRNGSLLGFGMAVTGVLLAWGSQSSTTVALAGIAALVVALRFKARLNYLGFCGAGTFIVVWLKLGFDIWILDLTDEVKALALIGVAALVIPVHVVYVRFGDRLKGPSPTPPPAETSGAPLHLYRDPPLNGQ